MGSNLWVLCLRGAKLVFYVVNSLKDRLQLCWFPSPTGCCWASHTATSLGFNYTTEVKKKMNRFDHRLIILFLHLTLSLSQLKRLLLLTSECPIPPRTTAVSLCTGDALWGAAVTAVPPAAGLSFRAAHKGELTLPGKLMVGRENMIKTCKTTCGLEAPDRGSLAAVSPCKGQQASTSNNLWEVDPHDSSSLWVLQIYISSKTEQNHLRILG